MNLNRRGVRLGISGHDIKPWSDNEYWSSLDGCDWKFVSIKCRDLEMISSTDNQSIYNQPWKWNRLIYLHVSEITLNLFSELKGIEVKKNRKKKTTRIEPFKLTCIVKWSKMVPMLCRVRHTIIPWTPHFIETFSGPPHVGYI